VNTSPGSEPGGAADDLDFRQTRGEARERAMSLVYEATLRGFDAETILGAQVLGVDPFVADVVRGVLGRREELDERIAEHLVGWTIARLAVLDRVLLELATYELVAHPETPVAVVINEAVELASRFSTEQSGRFLNGVLSSVASSCR
jgi:N utilization substance protein B